MKGVHLPLCAADNDNRGLTHRQVFHKIVAGIGNLFHAAHIQPHGTKNPLAFLLEIFG